MARNTSDENAAKPTTPSLNPKTGNTKVGYSAPPPAAGSPMKPPVSATGERAFDYQNPESMVMRPDATTPLPKSETAMLPQQGAGQPIPGQGDLPTEQPN